MASNDKHLKDVIDSPEELLGYLKERARRHTHYKYYGSYATIQKIIDNGHLLLSRGTNWNDTHDREQFQTSLPGFVRFGTCLSFSLSESVAMWMLYGGTQKDGAMIDLRPTDITSIMRQTKFELGHLGPSGFSPIETVSSGCSIYPLDVLYLGEEDNGGGYTVRRSPESLRGMTDAPTGDGILIKSYPWSYENEVRLVLDVPEAYVSQEMTHAWIPLGWNGANFSGRAYLAPNSRRSDAPGFQSSKLRGEIDWDVCSGCTFKEAAGAVG